jgi:fatty-acyl-CoA synthase
VARAPWLTQGYLKDPQSSEKLWEGGWLHTGDLATIDADGYVKKAKRRRSLLTSSSDGSAFAPAATAMPRTDVVQQLAKSYSTGGRTSERENQR